MAAVGRAESYGVTRFHGRIGPNEHSIPAVRSLDGSLIYFTDTTGENTSPFETDFHMLSDFITSDKDHLERVDHIAQALPEGRLDTWVLSIAPCLDWSPKLSSICQTPMVWCAAKRCPIGNARSAFP